jgi:nicotinamide-nucleotide amidase
LKQAYIISTGSELLLGSTVDSNAVFLAQRLLAMGIKVVGRSTVGDDHQQIKRAFGLGLECADLVISTGGLGPTFDDLTKQVACELMGCSLEVRPEEEERVRRYFAARGRPMPAINLRQALFPPEAVVLGNRAGTAPGMYLYKDDKYLILLPGPPREMQPMFTEVVEPMLVKEWGADMRLTCSRTIKTIGLGESQVEEKLGDLLESAPGAALALLAVEGEVHVRISWVAADEADARSRAEQLAQKIADRLGRNVYGWDDMTLSQVVARLICQQGRTLATAESCTGGLLGKMITDQPGSSQYYWGGAVTYSNQAKETILGVSPDTLRQHGAVSPETAEEMAMGMLQRAGTDYALAITGVAGPGGGTADKPVGLVYLALGHRDGCKIRELRLGFSRDYTRTVAARSALDLLRRTLQYARPDDKE